MRRLMVKLVALETALVGWLAYWIFLVYSNNPEVASGLASQLSKFPQLSFTTVDITVLVVISALSIVLAFKFDRGLKPGIRLERAIQMLESLMKRNLMLEAQVAEMKMASVQATTPEPGPIAEPALGSWERAFRTPIEAGPSLKSQIIRRGGHGPLQQGGDSAPDPISAKRSLSGKFESKPSQSANVAVSKSGPEIAFQREDRSTEDTVTKTKTESTPSQSNTSKEASPQRNQLPPITQTVSRKSTLAIAQPNSRRQPYIPIPSTRTVLPSSLPGSSVSPTSRSRSTTRSNQTFPSTVGPDYSASTSDSMANDSSNDSSNPVDSSSSEVTRSVQSEDNEREQRAATSDIVTQTSKISNKVSGSPKKRFPWEDE